MIICGFQHVLLVQMENEELWLRDAIKLEMVGFILWNLIAIH